MVKPKRVPLDWRVDFSGSLKKGQDKPSAELCTRIAQLIRQAGYDIHGWSTESHPVPKVKS